MSLTTETHSLPNITTEFVRIAVLSELEPHGQFTKWVFDHDILVYRYEGEVRAISNVCRHFGGPVGYHKMKNGTFTCLWHNYEFSAKDGSCTTNPHLALRQYKVKIESDSIWVQLTEKI